MNILSITTQKPHSTGSGTYLTEVVRALDHMGHRQAVVAGIYSNDSVQFPIGVDFYPVYYTPPGESPRASDIPFPILGMSDIMPYPSTRYAELSEADVDILEEHFISVIRHAIEELSPDLILCHHLYLLTAIVRRHFPDYPVVGLSHGSDLRQMQNLLQHNAGYLEPGFGVDRICKGIASLDHIFALHEEQKALIQRLYSVSPDKVSVIGTGYNASIFNVKERKGCLDDVIRIAFAGKICREKGVSELLNALTKLSQTSEQSFELLLAGGCQDDSIKEQLGIPAGEPIPIGSIDGFPFPLRYLGTLRQEELAAVFQESAIFVLPSYYEGLPLVVIEAMACGCEIICNDLPGVRGWLDSVIPNHRTKWVTMPEMESVDMPTMEAIPGYVEELVSAFTEMMEEFHHPMTDRLAVDTSQATWESVAKRILVECTSSTNPSMV